MAPPQIDVLSEQVYPTGVGHLKVRVRVVKPATNNDFIVTDGSVGKRDTVGFFKNTTGGLALDSFYGPVPKITGFDNATYLNIKNSAGLPVLIVSLV
jgi:hypothetical protein